MKIQTFFFFNSVTLGHRITLSLISKGLIYEWCRLLSRPQISLIVLLYTICFEGGNLNIWTNIFYLAHKDSFQRLRQAQRHRVVAPPTYVIIGSVLRLKGRVRVTCLPFRSQILTAWP